MENTTKDYSHIKGWGIDADPKNDPTYPMKNRTDAEQTGYSWDRPSLQPVNTEILRSIERPNITAVFGTSTPPSGLSGMLRRFAFKYSESSYGHWLPLLLADRVNVVEGVLDDLKNGHVPNIFAEKGMKAEWQHNRLGVIQKLAVAAVLTVGVIAYVKSRQDEDDDD
ncbi:hypothetical protein [Adhaeribacter rhizoryzae]|uniref:Uncharacterized protein n=1 Tax=Adhaeribacter rhizoryzae TaxID=2607907 RepID=A0A5M6D148_9BACT|nr:hypothetical protein [Adhaeribacter rhizoryzae]KAA5541221.1 hypothetical protein F0145_21565 [Adhaeribacter rhizoryzae]